MTENEQINTIRKELEDVYNGFIQAVKGKNVQAISSYFTPDCNMIFQGLPLINGTKNIEETVTPMLTNLVDFSIKINDIYVLPDNTVVELGENNTVQEVDGKREEMQQKYVVFWEKQANGDWKAKIDIGLAP